MNTLHIYTCIHTTCPLFASHARSSYSYRVSISKYLIWRHTSHFHFISTETLTVCCGYVSKNRFQYGSRGSNGHSLDTKLLPDCGHHVEFMNNFPCKMSKIVLIYIWGWGCPLHQRKHLTGSTKGLILPYAILVFIDWTQHIRLRFYSVKKMFDVWSFGPFILNTSISLGLFFTLIYSQLQHHYYFDIA